MKSIITVLAGVVILGGSQMLAQVTSTMMAPVPLTSEHHHHLVFSSPQVRAFYVVIPVNDQTLVHQHNVNYVWVGLGDADVVNATVNKSPIRLHSRDGMLHFSPGRFAHKAINVGNTTYRNVTVELLQEQTNPHNLCEEVLEGKPLHCIPATAGMYSQGPGVKVTPDFATDEIEFDTVTVAAGHQVMLAGAAIPPLVIALTRTTARAIPTSGGVGRTNARALNTGDVVSARANAKLTLRNTGSDSARFLVFDFLN